MQVCDYPEYNVKDVTWRRALKRALFNLQFGSAGMHMTHTQWGQTFDDDAMAVVTYVGYQTLSKQLNTTDPMIIGLANVTQTDAREVAENYSFLSLS